MIDGKPRGDDYFDKHRNEAPEDRPHELEHLREITDLAQENAEMSCGKPGIPLFCVAPILEPVKIS